MHSAKRKTNSNYGMFIGNIKPHNKKKINWPRRVHAAAISSFLCDIIVAVIITGVLLFLMVLPMPMLLLLFFLVVVFVFILQKTVTCRLLKKTVQ